MFSQTVEYALRAVVYLAGRGEVLSGVPAIAAATKVHPPYLAKVLQGLARSGLVTSRRGLGGGFALARPAAALTIWDVVDAVEPIRRIRTCPLGLESHREQLCPLHKKMDDALALIEQAFKSTTLADVLADPSPSVPLCPFPRGAPPEAAGRQPLPTL
jgi:Rrf2 family protein